MDVLELEGRVLMGMYDSVIASCPRCGADVEFQSKAGACLLNTYRPVAVPTKIAADLNGELETCPACRYVVQLSAVLSASVPMNVT
jgi:hypothetical protein